MSYSLVIKPEAELDIEDAYQYYETREPGLGSEFVRAADACLSKVGRNPNAYRIVHKQVRRALIRRFPYGLFYIFENNTIFVVACFHAKREPRSWTDRTL